MSEQQENTGSPESAAGSQAPVKKKKASWLRTILWMVAMMLLVNVVMAIIAYTLHRMNVF